MQSIRQLIHNLKGWITELGEKRKELLAQKEAEEDDTSSQSSDEIYGDTKGRTEKLDEGWTRTGGLPKT